MDPFHYINRHIGEGEGEGEGEIFEHSSIVQGFASDFPTPPTRPTSFELGS